MNKQIMSDFDDGDYHNDTDKQQPTLWMDAFHNNDNNNQERNNLIFGQMHLTTTARTTPVIDATTNYNEDIKDNYGNDDG